MDCTCSCPLRLQRCAGRRPQRGCEVLPADCLVIRGGRPAGQPASPEIREYADFKRNAEGLSALVIEGTIVSVAGKATEVPRLRFAARDASGQEIYTWNALPGRSILGPGEKLDFRSRFVSPPPNATDVMVRFFTPQDSATAAK